MWNNKFIYTAAAVIAIVSPVAAQEAPKDLKLKVSPQEISTIGEALGLMPYAKVAPLMNKLQLQINVQTNPPAPVATKPEEKKEVK